MIKVSGPNDLYGRFLFLAQTMLVTGDKPRHLRSSESITLADLEYASRVSPLCLERAYEGRNILDMVQEFLIFSVRCEDSQYQRENGEVKKPEWLFFISEEEGILAKEAEQEAIDKIKQQEADRKKESKW